MLIVYFSSISGNTQRFVEKLGHPLARIPLRRTDEALNVREPYVLAVPTYGGGLHGGAVPKQVIKFLNDERNRGFLRGIVSLGNRNFGAAFCIAGDIIHRKTGAPYLGKVEVFGTQEDVIRINQEIERLGDSH